MLCGCRGAHPAFAILGAALSSPRAALEDYSRPDEHRGFQFRPILVNLVIGLAIKPRNDGIVLCDPVGKKHSDVV